MSNFNLVLQYIALSMQVNFPFLICYIGLLWFIHGFNVLCAHRLNLLGIDPRSPIGLIGILCAPFLHGDLNHLFFNTIPLFLLANFVLMAGHEEFFRVTWIIIFVGGFGTWLFGRKALHIGASSLILGYFGYLLVNAYEKPNVLAIVLAMVCLYYFAALLFSLLPGAKGTSWEGHVFGFIGGVTAALLPNLLR